MEFPKTGVRATPWVELELNSLSASEKAIDYGNTVQYPHIWFPYSYSDKPVSCIDRTIIDLYLA